MPTKLSAENTQHLDLRGLSKVMIEMHILRLFSAKSGRLQLDCLFDEDPNEALRDLERYSCHWNFQRLEPAPWIIRHFAMTWEEAFAQRAAGAVLPLYEGPERRVFQR